MHDTRMVDSGLVLLVASGLAGAVNLASIAIAGLRIRRPAPLAAAPDAEPVSIVIPCRGIDAFSDVTLAAAFRLDYPSYELIFCVADQRDPIIAHIERAMNAHPSVPARIITGDCKISDNPKLNNCVLGWRAARHEWVVLADSNVLMPPDYLQQMLACWRADSGLVCSPPLGSHPGSFAAFVECAFLNTLQARWQYAAEAMGLGFAQGKSMLWRKSILDGAGGIEALAAEIAEDAAATKLIRAAGFNVHLTGAPFNQPLGMRDLRTIWSRQLRWARLRRVTFPVFFAPELLISVLIPATGLYAGLASIGIAPLFAAAAALLLIGMTYAAETALAAAKGWQTGARMILAMLARDVLMPAIWLAAWTGARVVWHGQAIRVRPRMDDSNTAPAS